MKLNKLLMTISIVVLYFLSCQKDSVPAIEIVAKVEDEYLTREQLMQWLPPDLPEEQKATVSQKYIERWVKITALAKLAQHEGIELDKYEKWSINFLKKDMLAQKFINTQLPEQLIVTEEDISNYYNKNKEEFKRDNDEVHLVQLFLDKIDRAIAREIRTSKSLLEVIQKNYLDTQSNRLFEKNGDLGYIPVKNLRKEISRLVINGVTGKIYGPIKIENGIYYFQMLDKQPAGSYRNLDIVHDEIRMRLILKKRQQIIEEITDRTIKELKVEVFLDHIK